MTPRTTNADVATRKHTAVATSVLVAGIIALGLGGLIIFNGLQHNTTTKPVPYKPLDPLPSKFTKRSDVITAAQRDNNGSSQNELLVSYAPGVKDHKAVAQEHLDKYWQAQPPSVRNAAAEIAATKTARPSFDKALTASSYPTTTAPNKKTRAEKPMVKDVVSIIGDTNNAGKVVDKFSARFKRGGSKTKPTLRSWDKVTFSTEVDVSRLINEFRSDKRIVDVQTNNLYETFTTNKTAAIAQLNPLPRMIDDPVTGGGLISSNDPFLSSSGAWGQTFPDLWGLQANVMDAVGAWTIQPGNKNAVVAVVDSGVDYSHPDLAANVWQNPGEIPGNGIDDDGNGFIDDVRGYDFTTCQAYDDWGYCAQTKERDADPIDDNGHGTHVAGTIAAVGNNGIGIIGVCPSCTVMPVKALNSQGGGTAADLIEAIRYAVDNGADIINMSWGGRGSGDPAEVSVLDYARAAGVTLVVAAGNSADDASFYFPASYSPAETVAATDMNDLPAVFSNFGPVDVAAPGVDILSLRAAGTDIYGDGSNFVPLFDQSAQYMRLSGTSMAAPHIAGLYGLLYSQGFDAATATAKINGYAEDTNNATNLGWDIHIGNGRANAFRALNSSSASILDGIITAPDQSSLIVKAPTVTISGQAQGTNFQHYAVDYAPARNTTTWLPITSSTTAVSGTSGTTLATWNTSTLDPGRYYVRLTVYGNDVSTVSDVSTVNYGATWMKQEAVPDFFVIPTLADFDPAYPGKEIMFEVNGNLRGYHGDGTSVSIPSAIPKSYYYRYDLPPVFGDLDRDGNLEFVTKTSTNKLTAYNSDGSAVAGFPVTFPALPLYPCQAMICGGEPQSATYDEPFAGNRVTLTDINNDGDLEIMIPVEIATPVGNPSFGRVLVYSHDGQLLTPTQDSGGYHYAMDMTYDANRGITVGDLDGNGDLELLTVDIAGYLYAWHHDGSRVMGWPQWSGDQSPYSGAPAQGSTVVTADLNGDWADEIITESDLERNIYVYNGNGTAYANTPYRSSGTSMGLAVADIDQDGKPEIINRTIGNLDVLRRSGVPMPGSPFLTSFGQWSGGFNPVAIADVSASSGLETVWTDEQYGSLDVLDAAGKELSNFPLMFSGAYRYGMLPLVGDVNGDGKNEVVNVGVGTGTFPNGTLSLTLLELNGPVSITSSWGVPFRDPAGTNRAVCPECHPAGTLSYDSQTAISCDASPSTPICEQNGYASTIRCATHACQSNCACVPSKQLLNGWPAIRPGNPEPGAVTTADIDHDGSLESIFESMARPAGGMVIKANGQSLPGFPVHGDSNLFSYGGYDWQTYPAVGNVDGTPELEISSTLDYTDKQYQRHAGFSLFNSQGQMMPGWPKLTEETGYQAWQNGTVMADVDPLRPGLEIIGTELYSEYQGVFGYGTRVYAWDSAGNNLPGFPKIIPHLATNTIPPAVGDINRDGKAEIILSGNVDGLYVTSRIIAIGSAGATLWTHEVPGFSGPVSIGDLIPTKVGREIVYMREIGSWDASGFHHQDFVDALDNAGNAIPGWPVGHAEALPVSSRWPTLGDVDGDGRLEVIIPSASTPASLTVYEDNGAVKTGWPISWNYFGATSSDYLIPGVQVTIKDLDGDGKGEIVFPGGDGDYKLTVFNDDTTLTPGWPMRFFDGVSSPAFADLDQDGKDEVVMQIGDFNRLYAYKTSSATLTRTGDWPSARFDSTLSGTTTFVPRVSSGGGGGGPRKFLE